MTYTRDEVLAAAVEYFDGDTLAADVWVTKYALRDADEHYYELTPTDMHRRIAREFARIEQKYPNPMSEDEIFNLLDKFKYLIPQGSPMSGIGNDYQMQSLSNCFVIPPPADSYGSILLADQRQAQIMKRRGGVGFDVSSIRPRGYPTSNAARTSDGLGVFMERFSNTCREVAQAGRRGALMLTVDVAHQDVETFIDIKRDLKKVTGANISLRISDEFMNAVENDEDFELRWPVTGKPKTTRSVSAKKIWDKIIDSAWSSAEPGVLFWDTMINMAPADIYADKGFKTVSTNPCAEIALSPWDSCRLLVVNVNSYVKDPFSTYTATSGPTFDFTLFHDHVVKAQRLMDDLVDLEIEALTKIVAKIEADPEDPYDKSVERDMWLNIIETAKTGRRTGLGITGLGDTLAKLNLRYGSQDAVGQTSAIYRALATAAHESSVILAEERGAFPICEPSRYENHPFFKNLEQYVPKHVTARFRKVGRRNIALTTTAPVGSVSTLTRTTSGIEPAYMLEYRRRRKVPSDNDVIDFVDATGDSWQEYDVYHPGFQEWMNVTGLTASKDSPYHGSTAMEIDWMSSIDIQAAAQMFVEHSISKTINLPSDVSREVVSQVYMHAWKTGCKGCTVYRDGSRSGVLISADKQDDVKKLEDRHAPRRPQELPCDIHRVTIKGEKWMIFVGTLDGKPYEVFGGNDGHELIEIPKKHTHGWITKRIVKTGSKYDLSYGDADDPNKVKDIVDVFDNPNYSAFTRMLSLSLRHGTPVQFIVEQLQRDRDADLFSFAKVMARVLKKYILDGTKASSTECNECGAENSLAYQEGCVTCTKCGYSKC